MLDQKARNDVIGKIGGALDHTVDIIRRAEAAFFAEKRGQKVVVATGVACVGEAVVEDTAFKIAAEFTL